MQFTSVNSIKSCDSAVSVLFHLKGLNVVENGDFLVSLKNTYQVNVTKLSIDYLLVTFTCIIDSIKCMKLFLSLLEVKKTFMLIIPILILIGTNHFSFKYFLEFFDSTIRKDELEGFRDMYVNDLVEHLCITFLSTIDLNFFDFPESTNNTLFSLLENNF